MFISTTMSQTLSKGSSPYKCDFHIKSNEPANHCHEGGGSVRPRFVKLVHNNFEWFFCNKNYYNSNLLCFPVWWTRLFEFGCIGKWPSTGLTKNAMASVTRSSKVRSIVFGRIVRKISTSVNRLISVVKFQHRGSVTINACQSTCSLQYQRFTSSLMQRRAYLGRDLNWRYKKFQQAMLMKRS